MNRHIMWSRWQEPGLEHLQLLQTQEGIIADGLVLGVQDQKPFRVHYKIKCTSYWELRSVHVSVLSDVSQSLHLLTDGAGSWTTQDGKVFPLLEGCLDVDLSITPFTNTLPIRRLALQPRMAATLAMAYIALPQMQIEVTKQRYTCLDATSSTKHYLFESLKNGVSSFSARLPVDQDGLVLDYPELFRRIGTR